MLILTSLLNLLPLMRPTLNRIGITAVSGTGLGLAVYNTVKNNQRAKKAEAEANAAKEAQAQLQKELEENRNAITENSRKLEEVGKTALDTSKKVDVLVAKLSSKANKYIEDFSFTSIHTKFFENIRELYHYVLSLDLEAQLALFNLFTSVLFLVLLSSTAINLYSQYLIDKFKLQERYPKLYGILEVRRKLQKLYLYYNSLLALYFILMQIFLNLMVLLN